MQQTWSDVNILWTRSNVLCFSRLLQLHDQMRAIDKAIQAPRIRKVSSKGGGGYSSQSGSGWDDYTKRTTTETLNQIRQQRVGTKMITKQKYLC